MSYRFISDLHLDLQRPDITRAFVAFCQRCQGSIERLYILGDLADAWLGDDDDGEIATIIRQSLLSLSGSGVQVYLMTGNRDFLMGATLASECGLELLSDPTVIDLYGNATLLMHGDSLCTGDSEYMAFREKIRNPDMVADLLAKPLDERREIARQLRQQSKSANASKASDIMDVSPEEVSRVMQQHNASLLIHGHTHRPAVHDLEVGQLRVKRYVLGDWDVNGWALSADENGFSLDSFSLDIF